MNLQDRRGAGRPGTGSDVLSMPLRPGSGAGSSLGAPRDSGAWGGGRGGSAAAPAARPGAAPLRRAADLWWLQPRVIVLMVVLPIYLSALSFDFARVVPNVYVPSWLYAFGALLILAIATGAEWAQLRTSTGPVVVPPHISSGCMLALLLPTLMAYLIWFGPLLWQTHLLVEVAQGARSEVRDSLSTIPGITTFTQFGVAYAIAFGIKSGAGRAPVRWFERLGFALILMMAVLRAFAWAERLAVIEILVCYLIARMAYLPLRTRKAWIAASVLPALGPFVLYGLFTASEYFRSWDYYKHLYDNVWAFTLDRLVTYYATAINNGIGALTEIPGWPFYSGAFSFDWAFFIPGMSRLLDGAIENPWGKYYEFLGMYGRPEFNSPTAYFRLMLDFGYAGTLLYFLGLGYLAGRAYIGFRRGYTFGLLAYPVMLLFLIESLRYSYFGESRIVPLSLGLMLVAWDIRRNRIKAGR